LSASRPGRFTPGDRVEGTHWIGFWVGPKTGLDAVQLPGIVNLKLSGRKKSWPIVWCCPDICLEELRKTEHQYSAVPAGIRTWHALIYISKDSPLVPDFPVDQSII
jgi:hypothetical protein